MNGENSSDILSGLCFLESDCLYLIWHILGVHDKRWLLITGAIYYCFFTFKKVLNILVTGFVEGGSGFFCFVLNTLSGQKLLIP
jgi:hypothetical protein